jgi:hypothetical protein
MKAHFMLIFIMPVFYSCKGQPPDWSNSSHWKIYKGEGMQVFDYSTKTMDTLPHVDFDNDSIQYYLKQATPIPKDHTPLWMGAWLASYESIDGKTHKVELSSYGVFFYDQASESYYAVPRELSRPWQNFLNSNIPK